MTQIPTTNHDYAPEITLGDNVPNVIGNTGDPNIFETYDVGPSITQILGNHSLHYGGEFSLYHDVPSGIGQPNGTFGFANNTGGNASLIIHRVAETLGCGDGARTPYTRGPHRQ